MDHTRTPSFRLAAFLGEVRRSTSAGCRYSSPADFESADRIELRYQDAPNGPERMIGLRAELRDGVPVIALYEHSELAPSTRADAP
ncbi:hypothetical protein [Roseisolibacter sp. H3M3-2]|uniref:hypothetical protein n=1 Tax=Roseisolibacter sp. H3M3-2 TaxID=3031323 RepID=UPI0023DBB3BD|nr:hypothetical protein [Roseisolibacter sp. H3M3-2]MDF1501797.1 hypothetical protein [Roseisolibacter sp. H3M3-2]